MNRTGDMIAVIACAGSKKRNAGRLVDDGWKVMFVAHPEDAPADGRFLYRRPDDPASSGRSFRDMLEEYNRDRRADNPWGLLPAWELYVPPAYRALRDACGADNFFVLSAGWGLVGADYLLPAYDITFSNGAKGRNAYKRREHGDRGYRDFAMLPKDTSKHTVFFGGKDYVPLFCSLTEGVAQRTVFHYSRTRPSAPGCDFVRYPAASPRMWYYECAMAFAARGCCV